MRGSIVGQVEALYRLSGIAQIGYTGLKSLLVFPRLEFGKDKKIFQYHMLIISLPLLIADITTLLNRESPRMSEYVDGIEFNHFTLQKTSPAIGTVSR
jgi:hypothetical protein